MKEFRIKVMYSNSPEKTAEELDRAVASLKGQREKVLEDYSYWDSWHFPDETEQYVRLFLSNGRDVYNPHPII